MDFIRVIPCPICNDKSAKNDCRMSLKSGWTHCHHAYEADTPPGWDFRGEDEHGFRMFAPPDNSAGGGRKVFDWKKVVGGGGQPKPKITLTGKPSKPFNLFEAMQAGWYEMPPFAYKFITRDLGLTAGVFDRLGVKVWSYRFDGTIAFCFPECDSQEKMIGAVLRTEERDGKTSKKFAGHRGLSIPSGWRDMPGPIFLVEGPTDVGAMIDMGLCAFGRPSNRGGAKILIDLINRNRDTIDEMGLVLVAENDRHADKLGRDIWPGREGAEAFAREVFDATGVKIPIAFPPHDSKDVREYLNKRGKRGHSLDEAGEDLREHLLTHLEEFVGDNDSAKPTREITVAKLDPLAGQEVIDQLGDWSKVSGPGHVAPRQPEPHKPDPCCPYQRGVHQFDREKLRTRLLWVDCGSLSCPHCKERKRQQYISTVKHHLHQWENDHPGEKVYAYTVGPCAWESVRKSIQRNKGLYFRVGAGNDLQSSMIASTVPPPASLVDPSEVREVTPTYAAERLSRYLADHVNLVQGVFSHPRQSWPLVGEEQKKLDRYIRIGIVRATKKEALDVLDCLKIQFEMRRHGGPFLQRESWLLQKIDDEKTVELLHQGLETGTTMEVSWSVKSTAEPRESTSAVPKRIEDFMTW